MSVAAKIISNELIQGDYFRVDFDAPEVCEKAGPGQFAHVRIANLRDRILRRPFSIQNVDDKGILSIVYKVVGEGTEALSNLKPGVFCDVMGPLGKGFTLPRESETPVIVAGGYGAAATYILAKRSAKPGILLLGARSQDDLLLVDEFEKLGFKTILTTQDGSKGQKGLVTEPLEAILSEKTVENPHFYGCGPTGMLYAMGTMLLKHGFDGELSLDHLMCCGVGACFACVVKVKADNEDGWRYARTCKEGPVFKASEVHYP